jgi:hypothetical protein
MTYSFSVAGDRLASFDRVNNTTTFSYNGTRV